jgi:hypothetical protein
VAGLGTPLALPLGGSGPVGQPFIVNLLPIPDSEEVKVPEFVRLSMRDRETYVDPATINLSLGYAKIFGKGTKRFDEDLPRTRLLSVTANPTDGDATIEVTGEGVRITKTAAGAQRSTFCTSVDVGAGFRSAMAMVRMRPEVADVGSGADSGPLNQALMPGVHPLPFAVLDVGVGGGVFGLESGPRSTGLYAYFMNIGTVGSPVRAIRLCGPDVAGVRTPDLTFIYDWSQFHRYFIIWNEVLQKAEFFADIVGMTTRIASLDISTFQPFGATGIGTPKRGGSTDFTVVYGQEGSTGDRATVSRVALAVDAGFPIIGGARPGNYISVRKSAEVVSFAAEDPRTRSISPWFNTPTELLSEDPDGLKEVVGQAFRQVKTLGGTTVTVFREEPGFFRTNLDGFLLEASFFGSNTLKDDAASGMGFVVSDGDTVFQLNLLDDGLTRSVGLLRRGGLITKTSGHIVPATAVNWASPVAFRFTVDTRRGLIEMFLLPDIRTPIMSIPFDRASLPRAIDYGWASYVPFLAIGHIVSGPALGLLDVYSFNYSHLYQAWEGRDGDLPEASGLAYVKVGGGSAAFNPDDTLSLTTTPGQQLYYHRVGILDVYRGAIVEARLQITGYKPRSPSGVFLVLDDGTNAWMMSFVDTDLGKYVTISLTAGLDDVGELAGNAGLAAKVSFPLDWTQPHTYRMERRPDDGLYIYIDQSASPSLVILDRDQLQIAETRQNAAYPTAPHYFPVPPATPNGAAAFGHFRTLGAVSVWEYVRHTYSLGFELSAKKNRTEAQLIEEIAGTEALVVAYCKDRDP